jgi:hypothetical protein
VQSFDLNSLSKRQCQKHLAAAGFSFAHAKRINDPNRIRFTFCDQWMLIESRSPIAIRDPLAGLMGEPGLWKVVADGDRQLRKIFELPLNILAENYPIGEPSNEAAKSSLAAALQWAKDTLKKERTDDWRPSPKREILELLDPKSLTAHCGTHTRQGEVICRPQRLALRFPLIFQVADDLPDTHRFWLRHLLIDAQNRWKLVRIGFRNKNSVTSVQAEIDLTGAPPSLLNGLVKVALAALHAVVAWVVPSADFLVKQASGVWALNVPNDVKINSRMQEKGGD